MTVLDREEALVVPQFAAWLRAIAEVKTSTGMRMLIRRATLRSYFVGPKTGHLLVVDRCRGRQGGTAASQ